MAVGWSRDGAVQDQIDATVEDGVQQRGVDCLMARAQRIVRNVVLLFQMLAVKQSLEFAFVSVANQNSKRADDFHTI